MPTIAEATQPINESAYEAIMTGTEANYFAYKAQVSAPPSLSNWLGVNPFMRCPLPQIGGQADNLRQFYRDGIPQHRILLPL